MKTLMVVFISFSLVVACSYDTAHHTSASVNHNAEDTVITTTQPISEDATVDINSSIKVQDYRLYATSGRSITIPGVAIEKVAGLIRRCGVKYLPHTGDVIVIEQDRKARKKQLEYMKRYNQKMLKICLENHLNNNE